MSEYTLQCRGQAKYPYQAQAEDELSFEEGDALSVWSCDDSGWWYATNERTLEYGFIPESYFEKEEEDTSLEASESGEDESSAKEMKVKVEASKAVKVDSSTVKDLGVGADRATVPAVVKRSRAASLARQSSSKSSLAANALGDLSK